MASWAERDFPNRACLDHAPWLILLECQDWDNNGIFQNVALIVKKNTQVFHLVFRQAWYYWCLYWVFFVSMCSGKPPDLLSVKMLKFLTGRSDQTWREFLALLNNKQDNATSLYDLWLYKWKNNSTSAKNLLSLGFCQLGLADWGGTAQFELPRAGQLWRRGLVAEPSVHRILLWSRDIHQREGSQDITF